MNYTDSRRARGKMSKANPIGISMKIINRIDASNETKPIDEPRQMTVNERNIQSKMSPHKTQEKS